MKENKKEREKTSESKIEISKKPIIRLCNSCKSELPKTLDRGICPICGRRN